MNRILFLTIAEVDQNRGNCVAMEEKSEGQDAPKDVDPPGVDLWHVSIRVALPRM
jgi:hypothetical protein